MGTQLTDSRVATKQSIEEGLEFAPRFNDRGLISAVTQDAQIGQFLMLACMNRAALDLTIQTGYATYFSRSREQLWKKGQESGHLQKVEQILVDCDSFRQTFAKWVGRKAGVGEDSRRQGRPKYVVGFRKWIT